MSLYFLAQTDGGHVRFFRFARTVSAERLDEKFTYPARTTYDPDQMLRDSFGIFIGDDYPVENVRVRLSARWSAFAKSHRWHPSQQAVSRSSADAGEGGVELRFRVRICPEFETWLLGFGEDVEVLAPEALRMKIAARISRATAIYEKPNDP